MIADLDASDKAAAKREVVADREGEYSVADLPIGHRYKFRSMVSHDNDRDRTC